MVLVPDNFPSITWAGWHPEPWGHLGAQPEPGLPSPPLGKAGPEPGEAARGSPRWKQRRDTEMVRPWQGKPAGSKKGQKKVGMPEMTSGRSKTLSGTWVGTASRQGPIRSSRDVGSENVSSHRGLVLFVRVSRELQEKRQKWS